MSTLKLDHQIIIYSKIISRKRYAFHGHFHVTTATSSNICTYRLTYLERVFTPNFVKIKKQFNSHFMCQKTFLS